MSSSETERSSEADSSAERPGALPAVAPQLRALRRRASLTLEAAARAAGLSPAHLSRLETGQRQPSLPMLLALARVYGTTVSELLGETVAGPGRRRPRGRHGTDRAPAAGRTGRPALPGAGCRPCGSTCRTAPRATSCACTPARSGSTCSRGRLRLRLGDTAHRLGARRQRPLRLAHPAPDRRRGPRRRRAALRPHPAAEPHGHPVPGPHPWRARHEGHGGEVPPRPVGAAVRLPRAGHVFAAFLYLLFGSARRAGRRAVRSVEQPLAQPLPGLRSELAAPAPGRRRRRPRSPRWSRRPPSGTRRARRRGG